MSQPTIQDRLFQQAADHSLLEQAKEYAVDYQNTVFDRAPFPTSSALAGLAAFDEPLPLSPADPAEMLRLLHSSGSPATVATTGGRFYGLVTGGVLPPVIAAKWLADVWDQLAALYVTSPVVSKLEALCEQWLVDLFQLPAGTVAGFVSGTAMSTMCGLAAARYELLRRSGWDVNSQGLFGAPPIRVVVGEEAHSTVFKALALLGLGSDRVEKVPVDEQGRMIAARLPVLDDRTLVIAQAGNVNTGAFDPFDEIGDRVRKAGAWLHIDGAFGLWAAASEAKRPLTHGMEKADSWSVDAHKTLNAPYDGAIIFCKHRDALVSALQNNGSYIVYSENRDGMLYTPEMSRRGRAIELWATLKTLGRSGIEELVDQLCARASQAAELLRAAGFPVLNDVVFNQVLVTGSSPDETRALVQGLQQSGEGWCGGALWHGQPVVRVSVCSWATTEKDIDRLAAAFVAVREQFAAREQAAQKTAAA